MARPQTFETEQALKQAIELFWKNGYERTSLSNLLAQMHIQRSSFYNTFGDKHKLFIQSLDHYMRAANDEFIVDALNATGAGLETIRQVFRGMIDILAADAMCRGCLMVNTQVELASRDAVIKQMIDVSLEKIQAALYNVLKQAQAVGEISPELDLEAASKFLTSTLITLRLMGRSTNRRQDFEQIAHMALSILER